MYCSVLTDRISKINENDPQVWKLFNISATYDFTDGWVTADDERNSLKPSDSVGDADWQLLVQVLGTSLQSFHYITKNTAF